MGRGAYLAVGARGFEPPTFRSLIHGLFPRSSVTTGFVLAAGMRASSTSIRTSFDGRASAISRRALFMCPGYHSMDISPGVYHGNPSRSATVRAADALEIPDKGERRSGPYPAFSGW
jgi:hypothetical protein